MHSLVRTVFAILILMMGAFTLSATAGSGGVQPAVLTSDADSGRFLPAAFKTNIRDMTLGEVAAIVGGAAVVGTAADMTFSGGFFTVLGAAAGAVLGSEWYERGWWPFERSILGTSL